MRSVKFYLDHPYDGDKLKKTPVSVYLKVYFDKDNIIIIYPGERAIPTQWNFSKGRAKERVEGAIELNEYLAKIELYTLSLLRDDEKRTPSKYKSLIETYIDPVIEESKVVDGADIGFMKRFDVYIENKEDSLSDAYKRKFKLVKKELSDYFGDLTYEQLSVSILDQYCKLCINRGNGNNTVASKVKVIITILNDAVGDGIKVSKKVLKYSYKTNEIDTIRLTWEEFEAMEAVDLSGELESLTHIRDMAAFRGLTGLRWGDMSRINAASVQPSAKGKILRFSLGKGQRDFTLKLPEKALKILEKYDYIFPDYKLPVHNRLIKVVCKKAKINSDIEIIRYSGNKRVVKKGPKWEFVGSHSFRRTFGRRLYDKDVKTEEIQKLLGHKDLATTLRYIGVTKEEANDSMVEALDEKKPD